MRHKECMKLLLNAFFMFSLMCLAMPSLANAVVVRAGIHDRFNRLVFDWNDPSVKYDLSQDNGHVIIQFNRAVAANINHVKNAQVPFIRNLEQTINAKGLLVSFDVPQNTRVQGFKVERNIAFDVLLLKKGKPNFAPVAEKTVSSEVVPDQKNATDLNPEVAETVPAVEAKASAEEVAPKTTPKVAEEKPADPIKEQVSEITETPPAPPAKQTGQIDVAVLPSTEEMSPEDTVIQLQPSVETRLAVWQRGYKFWVVLDKPANMLPVAVQGAQAQNFAHPWRFSAGNNTAFVFDLPTDKKQYVHFKRTNNRWDITLSPQAPEPLAQKPISAMVMQAQNGVLSLYAGDQPSIANFNDPWLGDQLAFIPVRRPESRIAMPRRFAVFNLPQTILGAVVVSSQTLALTPIFDKVDINLQGQQSLGFSTSADLATAAQLTVTNIQTAQDFMLWPWPSLPQPHNMAISRQTLESKVMSAQTPQAKAAGYVQLARYLLSQGRGVEASGLLRLAATTLPKIADTLAFKALSGIESAVRAQPTQASEFFNDANLAVQPAAYLWSGYAFALNENWRQARAQFSQSQSQNINPLATLSPTWQVPILLAMAEADLMAQDLAGAQQRLNKIPKDATLTASQLAAKNYLASSIQQAAQQPKRSQATLEALSRGPDQLYRIKSQLRLIENQQKQKDFDIKTAIQTLEKMRYSWRGDQLEIRILDLLGQLYIANQRFFDGLTVWREAASLATDQTDTDQLATKMGKVFADLFVRNGADKISPLQALALYERFKELTPTGADGVVAQRYLAKRLQRVDLLDQADHILQSVLQQQPLGELAAQIGTELAQIRIKNMQPAQALKALDDSTPQGENTAGVVLPQALQEQRYFLRARALADTGKRDDALAMLASTNTEQGLSLSADLLWATGRWDLAAVELAKLLQLYPTATQSADKATTQRRADVVLRQAIALTLAGDQMGVVTLAQTEQEFMAGKPQAEAFNMITQGGSDGKLADLPTLQKYLNDVNLFEKFLQSENKAQQADKKAA